MSDDPRDRRTTLHEDLEKVHERASATDRTLVRFTAVVEALSETVNKLQDRMDNPPAVERGPTWAAIGALFISGSLLMILIVGGYVTLTQNPIIANQVVLKEMIQENTEAMRRDNIREARDAEENATTRAELIAVKENQGVLFAIGANLRTSRLKENAAEIARLKGIIEGVK